MKKMDNISITRFETECFYIDIIDKGDLFEAWLSGKGYGVSELMFGVFKEQPTVEIDSFLEMVDGSLDDYEYDYYRKHDMGWDDED